MAMSETILVVVYGGVVQHVAAIPTGVTVEVRDYDVDPQDDPDYPRDRDGDPYAECVWGGDEPDLPGECVAPAGAPLNP